MCVVRSNFGWLLREGLNSECLFIRDHPFTAARSSLLGRAQVCAVWTRQRGLTMALGTGSDPAKVAQYTTEDLDIFAFNMTSAEVRRD